MAEQSRVVPWTTDFSVLCIEVKGGDGGRGTVKARKSTPCEGENTAENGHGRGRVLRPYS